MCGAYALHGPQVRHREDFEVGAWPEFPERWKITPSSWVPIVRQAPDGQRVADLLRWGLIPHWAKDESIARKLINARGETVAEKPSFRSAYQRRRCIVPASGFYEWQQIEGQRWKQPWYFQLRDGAPMAMAGLWESWTTTEGEIIRTFCVVTTAANALMAPIHDRMPVLLPRESWATWLNPEANPANITPLVGPADPGTMTAWPVSRKVSTATANDSELIAPMPPKD
jgi:putative SOS response-associated peptidase YedK